MVAMRLHHGQQARTPARSVQKSVSAGPEQLFRESLRFILLQCLWLEAEMQELQRASAAASVGKLVRGVRCASVQVPIPRYDKSQQGGRGDRAPRDTWPVVRGPVDVVLFEGWMLGFRPAGDDSQVAALEQEDVAPFPAQNPPKLPATLAAIQVT